MIALFSIQTLVAGLLNVLVVALAIEVLDIGTAGVGWLAGMIGIGATVGVFVVTGFAGRCRLSRPFAVGLFSGGSHSSWSPCGRSWRRHSSCSHLSGSGNTLVDVSGSR